MQRRLTGDHIQVCWLGVAVSLVVGLVLGVVSVLLYEGD